MEFERLLLFKCVAPLVGAWIEIVVSIIVSIFNCVAPLVGAWIEICHLLSKLSLNKSHLS